MIGGGFKDIFDIFTPIFVEMMQFEKFVFPDGWFNQQVENQMVWEM